MVQSRREFLKSAGVAGAVAAAGRSAAARGSSAQPRVGGDVRMVETALLDIGYEESGDCAGFPVMLLHGFPYDVRAWDDVVQSLAVAGFRVLVPYLRGYGPTRFRDPSAPRMAEQAAIAQDVVDFADALGLERVALAGFDWGNRAACITAILHPERVRAQVAIGGYSVQNTVTAVRSRAGGRRGAALVSVVLPDRAGTGRSRGQPERHLPAPVEYLVARVGVRQRGLRPIGGLVRQSGFRRRRDPFVSAPSRKRPWRRSISRRRATAGRTAAHRRAGNRLAWGGQWIRPALSGSVWGSAAFHEPGRASHRRGRRTRSRAATTRRGVVGVARVTGPLGSGHRGLSIAVSRPVVTAIMRAQERTRSRSSGVTAGSWRRNVAQNNVMPNISRNSSTDREK